MRVLPGGCYSRRPSVTLGVLLIVGMLVPVVTSAQTTMPPSTAPAGTEADVRQTLVVTLQNLEGLLASIDQLVVNLTQTAQGALANADAARNVDERARYEALYSQASGRLAELQDQRSQIVQLVAQIRAKLGAGSIGK